MFKLTQSLKKYLENYGFNVVMTRENLDGLYLTSSQSSKSELANWYCAFAPRQRALKIISVINFFIRFIFLKLSFALSVR